MATYSKGWRQLKKKKQPRQQRPEHLKFLFEYVLIATPSALFFRAFFFDNCLNDAQSQKCLVLRIQSQNAQFCCNKLPTFSRHLTCARIFFSFFYICQVIVF
jgi:hypothetical protein